MQQQKKITTRRKTITTTKKNNCNNKKNNYNNKKNNCNNKKNNCNNCNTKNKSIQQSSYSLSFSNWLYNNCFIAIVLACKAFSDKTIASWVCSIAIMHCNCNSIDFFVFLSCLSPTFLFFRQSSNNVNKDLQPSYVPFWK